jgi:hypothetical protein
MGNMNLYLSLITEKVVDEMEECKISPLVVNHPWISISRGSSSEKRRPETQLTVDLVSSPHLRRTFAGQRKSFVELSNPETLRFRALMAREGSTLSDLCNRCEELLSSGKIPEKETDTVRAVIGQAHFLQRELFTAFAILVNAFENEKDTSHFSLEKSWKKINVQVSSIKIICYYCLLKNNHFFVVV